MAHSRTVDGRNPFASLGPWETIVAIYRRIESFRWVSWVVENPCLLSIGSFRWVSWAVRCEWISQPSEVRFPPNFPPRLRHQRRWRGRGPCLPGLKAPVAGTLLEQRKTAQLPTNRCPISTSSSPELKSRPQAKPPILGWFPGASLNFHQKRTAGLASSPRSPAKRNDTCSALVSGFGGNYPSNPLRPKNARNWIAGNQDSPLKWFCQKSKTQELRVILHFHFCWKEGNPDTKPTHLKPRPINLQNR